MHCLARLVGGFPGSDRCQAFADEVFYDFRESCGVGWTMSASLSLVRISSTAGSKRRMYLAQFRIPHGEAGGLRRRRCAGRCGRGRWRCRPSAEEIDEHTLRRGHVGVHENAHGFAGAHGGEEAAHEIVFVDGAVAVHGAVALDEGVDVGIIEGAHDDRQRMPLQRVREGGEFPGSEVGGEKENAFAASVGALEVLKAIIDNDARGIFDGCSGGRGRLRRVGVRAEINSPRTRRRRSRGDISGKASARLRVKPDATEASVNSVHG